MSAFVLRYAPPALPGVVSWWGTDSPPPSKASDCTMPGSFAGPDDRNGADFASAGDSLSQFTLAAPPLTPIVSNTSRSDWRPAVSVTGFDSERHVCHAPVSGTATDPVTFAP